MRNLLILLTSTCVLAGCESASWDPEGVESPVVVEADAVMRPLGTLDVPGAEVYRGEEPAAHAARLELLDGVMDRVQAVRDILVKPGTLEHKHGRVRRVIEESGSSEAEAWFVEQLVASMFLEHILMREDSGEMNDEVTYYLDILVRRKSPNAVLVADALEHVRGHWTKERIRAAAGSTNDQALTWLERECKDCPGQKLSASGKYQRSDMAGRIAMADAMRRLEVLSR